MLIALVGPIYTPDLAQCHGVPLSGSPMGYPGAPLLSTLICGLLERGYRINAYTTDTRLYRQTQKCRQVTIGEVNLQCCPARPHAYRPNGILPGRIFDFFRFERARLAHAMRLDQPDVIHAHWTYEFALSALSTGIPTVVTVHDSPAAILKYTRSLYRLGRYFMAREVLEKAPLLTAVSPYLAESVHRYVNDRSIKVIPNPISEKAEKENVRRLKKIATADLKIAMAMNGWDRRKNPAPSILAFNVFHALHPNSEFHLFGFDFGVGMKADLWCREHNISHGIVFHGPTSQDKLFSCLKSIDIFIHPSLEESFGMTVAEAMALGVPVIAGLNSGAIPWVVGSDGILVDIRDVDSILSAINRLANSPWLRKKLGDLASLHVRQRFSSASVIAAYEESYRIAIQQQKCKKDII